MRVCDGGERRVRPDLWKRQLPHHLLAEEDHSGNPEKQDVVTGFQQRVGVEGLKFGTLGMRGRN